MQTAGYSANTLLKWKGTKLMIVRQIPISERVRMVPELVHCGPESSYTAAGTCQKSPSFAVNSNKFITLIRPKSNFGLTVGEFEDLCDRLRRGDTILFEKIFLAHFSDCTQYLVARYKVQYDDAYDATMDTLLSFRQRLVDGKVQYGNMRFLFTQMASQHLVRKLKSSDHKLIDDLQLADPLPDQLDKEDLRILSLAWSKLSDDCRKLLQLNYYQGLKLVDVARQLNRKSDTVRKQKERCQGKLIEHFKEQSKLFK